MTVRIFKVIALSTLLSLFLASSMGLSENKGYKKGKSLRKATTEEQAYVGINNWGVEITNYGSWGQDVAGITSGGEFPRGSGIFVIYAAGMYIGAKIDGKVMVSQCEHGSEFRAGPILDSNKAPNELTPSDPGASEYRNYVLPDDAANWPVNQGAPVDALGNPIQIGDSDIWSVYNDLDPIVHEPDNVDPLGAEVHQTTFGFDAAGALGDIFFVKWDIINKSNKTWEDAYVAVWYDPDVTNNSGNDICGCDTLTSLGYTYNSDDSDEPVAFGSDFFQGPLVDSSGDVAYVMVPGKGGTFKEMVDKKALGLTAFSFYINGTDPESDVERYNIMKGLDRFGTPRTADQAGFTGGHYDYPGDPVTGTGTIDPGPADKRMCMVSGPFNMAPGDTQVVVCANIGSLGSDRLNAVTLLRSTDLVAQATFDAGFIVPKSPPTPGLTVTASDEKVTLTWDDSPELSEDTYGEEVGMGPVSTEGYDSTTVATETEDPEAADFFLVDTTVTPADTTWYIMEDQWEERVVGYEKNDFQGYRVYRSQTGTAGT